MKSHYSTMLHSILFCALIFAPSLVVAATTPAKTPIPAPMVAASPRSRTKEEITRGYQQRYNIAGHFVIKDGYMADMSAADGPVNYRFNGAVLKPGYYVFTFNHYESSHFLFEVRKVILNVVKVQKKKDAQKTHEYPTRVEVTPEDSVWEKYLLGSTFANIGDEILVQWSSFPGGEGIPNEWKLTEIEFMQSLVQQSNATSSAKAKRAK